MKVVQRGKSVREVRARVTINVPAWVVKELGFQPGDRPDWVPLEDDDGTRLVALRRVEKGEEEEKKRGEVGGKEKEGEEKEKTK